MKTQPIQPSPTFKMNWTQRQVEQTKLTQIYLNNGNRLAIRETPYYKLYSLFDKANEWIKSKLIYKQNKKVIRSER